MRVAQVMATLNDETRFSFSVVTPKDAQDEDIRKRIDAHLIAKGFLEEVAEVKYTLKDPG